jgi:uncharacterized protein (TIGR02246 family)
MNKLALCLTLAIVLGVGCAPSPAPVEPEVDLEAEKSAVMQADRDFAAATAANGIEGWLSYFADDGAMLPATDEVVRGHESIRTLMAAGFANPDFTITWTPEFAEVSRAGDLAYTYGTYESGVSDPEETAMLTRGRYVTIWRKNSQGAWKVVLDIGNIYPESQE